MKRPLAIFTITQGEMPFLATWLQHNLPQVDASSDIYVLNHDVRGDGRRQLVAMRDNHCFNVVPVHNRVRFDSHWLTMVTRQFQRFLLNSYHAVLFSAVDELVMPTPESGLRLQELAASRLRQDTPFIRCNAFEVVHNRAEEPALIYQQAWLDQRKWWYHTEAYSKCLLSRIPLNWSDAWRTVHNVPRDLPITRDLLLVHLHKIDFHLAMERHQLASSQPWSPEERLHGTLRHQLVENPEQLERWILSDADNSERYAELQLIPDSVKRKLVISCSP